MIKKNMNNRKFINSVFDSVYNRYDLMNDLMSFGIHRFWKYEVIKMMNPSQNQNLIDVACGTGDIAKLYSEVTNKKADVLAVDPNKKMLEIGKKKHVKLKNIKWELQTAENLKVKNNSYDFYVISFGLRNTTNINQSISEAYRVLKKGGRFLCLEFSKIENTNLDNAYKNFSKILPKIGKFVIGKEEPYEYLIDSIKKFYNQRELLELLNINKFVNSEYTNLSGGIVAIHSGWKI